MSQKQEKKAEQPAKTRAKSEQTTHTHAKSEQSARVMVEEKPVVEEEQSAVERAEETLDSMGRNIGLFTALAVQRIQRVAGDLTGGIAQQGRREHRPGRRSSNVTTEQAQKRAEEMVEQTTQRVGFVAAIVNYQAQRTVARVREEAEDFWADAQHIRRERNRKRR